MNPSPKHPETESLSSTAVGNYSLKATVSSGSGTRNIGALAEPKAAGQATDIEGKLEPKVRRKGISADAVADYFLWFCDEHGDLLSNLKLQKLVYYAQAWFLGLHGKQLFPDKIEAWVHGPVVPELYRRFRTYKWNPITERVRCPELPKEVKEHLNDVFDAYGRFSAWEIERITHSEQPWIEARQGLSPDQNGSNQIRPQSMREFYRRISAQN